MHHGDSSCTSCQLEIPEGVTILHVEYDVACPTKLSSHAHDSCIRHRFYHLDPVGTRPKNANDADFARRTLAHCQLERQQTYTGSQWQTMTSWCIEFCTTDRFPAENQIAKNTCIISLSQPKNIAGHGAPFQNPETRSVVFLQLIWLFVKSLWPWYIPQEIQDFYKKTQESFGPKAELVEVTTVLWKMVWNWSNWSYPSQVRVIVNEPRVIKDTVYDCSHLFPLGKS